MAAIGTLPVLFATGVHGSRPAASAVGKGGLYSCTTHSLIYQTDGSSWATWATLGASALAHGYNTVATDQSTTSTSYTDLTTTGPAVTITVNTKAKVTISAIEYGSVLGTICVMGFAASSANTIAAADTAALIYVAFDNSVNQGGASRVCYLSGLTPGSTTFTAKYKRGTATGTAHFIYREILVECLD